MIVDIPTATDFQSAGLKQVHLAWQIAMQSVHDFDEATYYKLADETPEEAAEEFWQRSQPALANAYSLIQQGMELALKGRIAAITPYLLIGDPTDWTRSAASTPVSFGEFRTLDAADLVRVHNSVAAPPLDDTFKTFFDQVRRDRNRIMHSSAPGTFTPGGVVRTLLIAIEALFNDVPWPRRLLELEEESKFASLGFVDSARNNVLRQIDTAIRTCSRPRQSVSLAMTTIGADISARGATLNPTAIIRTSGRTLRSSPPRHGVQPSFTASSARRRRKPSAAPVPRRTAKVM